MALVRRNVSALLVLVAACRYEESGPVAVPVPVPMTTPPPSGPPVAARPGTPPPAPPPVSRAPWAVANEDGGDDYVVGPPTELPDCVARLAALGVRARPSSQPVHQEGKQTCGAPQVVTYEAGPSGARWSSPPQVTCLVALALSRFETIIAEEAQRQFATKVKRIDHLGTYACRPMIRFNMASEHSFANAIDIRGVELADGRRINVESHWGLMTAPPSTPAAHFLRTVGRRAYDEGAFSVVLGPPWDALHKDHLHLDQARYRVDGLVVRR